MKVFQRWNGTTWEQVGILPDAFTRIVVNAQTGNYTVQASDAGKVIEMTSTFARTITIPPDSTVDFPVGTIIEFFRGGGGSVSIEPGAGVTINAVDDLRGLRALYSSASIRKRSANTWALTGDLASP